jgi:hypothetical protein
MSIRITNIGLLSALLVLWTAAAFAVQPLEITDVYVEENVTLPGEETPTILFTIDGNNFLNGGDVELWLGDIPLRILTWSNTTIEAALPLGMPTTDPGSYQLIATTGGGTVRHDDFDGLTIGAEGLQGIQGEQGLDQRGRQDQPDQRGRQDQPDQRGRQDQPDQRGRQDQLGQLGQLGRQGHRASREHRFRS